VSILITSFNYGRFLPQCLDSALGQSYPNVEVIVVDDGSQDSSREVLRSYGDRIRWKAQENKGMVGAVNTGFPITKGEIICFLDADDALFPHAMEAVTPYFEDPGIVEVDWALQVVNEKGDPGRTIMPKAGHAWSRRALEMLFPLPEPQRRYGIDGFLWTLVPLWGQVLELEEPLGIYRWHGENWFARRSMEERARIGVEEFDFYFREMERWAKRLGKPFDYEECTKNSWFHQWNQALKELREAVPKGCTLILVDEEQWSAGPFWEERHVLPFLERDGAFFGLPADDHTAIRELRRMMEKGAGYLVFISSTFWWLDHYRGLAKWLELKARVVLENSRLKVFKLEALSLKDKKQIDSWEDLK